MTGQARGFVDTRNPIKWRHPLNSGLLCDIRAIKGWMGGASSVDLTKSLVYSLVNGPPWSSVSAPGGFSSILAQSTNSSYVSVPLAIPFGAAAWTIACWVYVLPGGRLDLATDRGSGDRFGIGGDSSGLYAVAENGGVAYSQCASPANATWTLLSMVFNPGVISIYFNGVSQSVADSGGAPASTLSFSSTYYIGSTQSGGGNYSDMYFDGFRAYNRALTAAENLALYNEQILGSPHLYNRVSPFAMFGKTATSTFNPALYLDNELAGGMQTLGL